VVTSTTSTGGGRLLDGRYRLGERVGGGAVAEVFRGLDERLQRPVAVKLFRGDAAEQLHRHEAEMLTLAGLDHPSLVTVFDAGNDDETGQPYLVMQLVEGTTLGDELRRGRLTGERTARYGAALADALAYVHERGFVHRDIKPANVLVSEDGRVHLADFGIARLVDSAHQTKTGDVLGTPAYFAPEQVAGEDVGPAADIYALGIVLLECLTGKRPYEGTAMEVAMARLARPPEVPAELGADWGTLLEAMTRRQPDQRPHASAVAEGLRQIADGFALDETMTMAPPAGSGPAATQVMPATMVAPATATAAWSPAGEAPVRRRRGPSGLVIALVVLLAAAVVAAILVAVNQSGDDGTDTTVKHGKPRLEQPLERDLRELEELVTP
jgi:serine/threonine protein kinase